MPGNLPLIYRMAGVAAIGTAAYGLVGSVYHGIEISLATDAQERARHRVALERDFAFLALSLPAFALSRSARRFSTSPAEGYGGSAGEEELVHVIPLQRGPSEYAVRLRQVEDAYQDVLLRCWIEEALIFREREEGFARMKDALNRWEREKREGDEISALQAMVDLAALKMDFSILLSRLGNGTDAEIYEKSATFHLMVVDRHIRSLNENLKNTIDEAALTPQERRVSELEGQMREEIHLWGRPPKNRLSEAHTSARLEVARERAKEASSKKQKIDVAESLINLGIAERDHAVTLRLNDRAPESAPVFLAAKRHMEQARRIIRSLPTP